MDPAPLQRVNFVDQAYLAIKQLIVGGELAAGGQLNIDALARRLGVSNSPVREALRRLEHERWVETVPFRGAFVRRLDETELAELYELRRIIELAALSKLMRSGGRKAQAEVADERAVLRACVAQIEAAITAGDPLAYLHADARFHQAIVDLAGNRRLSDLFRTLVEQGRGFMLGRTPEAMARCRREPDEHAQLLDKIEQGDRREACRLLKRHLRISRDDIGADHRKG